MNHCRFPSVIRPGGSPNRLDSIARSSLSTTSLLRIHHFDQFWTFFNILPQLSFSSILIFFHFAATGTAKNLNKALWERIKLSSFQWYPLSGMFDPEKLFGRYGKLSSDWGEVLSPSKIVLQTTIPCALVRFLILFIYSGWFWSIFLRFASGLLKSTVNWNYVSSFLLDILIIIIVRVLPMLSVLLIFFKNCLRQSTGFFLVDSALKLFNWMSRW